MQITFTTRIHDTSKCLCMISLLFACSTAKKLVHVNPEPVKDAVTNDAVLYMPVDSSAIKAGLLNRSLQIKYATALNVAPNSIVNIKLYAFIDEWLGAPFRWGGTDKQGIDCSAFVQRLFIEVYGLRIPRTSAEQLFTERVEAFTSARHLAEGDLVFFKTMQNKRVSHVGIYLCNGMFVNCATSTGVNVSNLHNAYWKKCFVAAGRVKAFLSKNSVAPGEERGTK